MCHTLSIVGASARAAAQSAVRAGFAVVAADLFADLDLVQVAQANRTTRYPHGLAETIAGGQPGCWMYTGALENHPALVKRLSRIRPLWGNSAEVLRRVRQPLGWTAALRAAGLRAPGVAINSDGVPRDGAWLAKPLRSAAGTGIVAWHRRSRLSPGQKFYFQQRIEGKPISAVFVAAGGQATLWGVTRQLIGEVWCGAKDFAYCGSIGPLALPPKMRAEFEAIGSILAGEFRLTGLFGVDAVFNADGLWPVEINPRYTASVELLERASDRPAIALHVEACQSGSVPRIPQMRADHVHGKAILFAPRQLSVTPEVVQAVANPQSRWPVMADIPSGASRLDRGLPIVTLFAEGPDESATLKALRARVAAVLSFLLER